MTIAIKPQTPGRDRIIALARAWRPKPDRAVPKKQSATDSIIEQVAFWHCVSAENIFGRSRSWKVVAARFDAIAAVYINCRIAGRRYRLTELGRLFDRDHATIIQALRQRNLHS